MQISDMRLEMEIGGVYSADIAEIIELCVSKGLNIEMVDEELIKRGYDKIFTIDYDAYDDYDSWENDDGYSPVEKFPHKQHFSD